jgi:hypothetical protein
MKTPQKVLAAAVLVLATATGTYLYTGGTFTFSPEHAAGSGIDGVSKAKKYKAADGTWIDLQGAELLALKGAENSLEFCDSLLIEISKVDIYENGVLWPELKNWLIKRNFYPVTEPLENHTDVLFKKNNIN